MVSWSDLATAVEIVVQLGLAGFLLARARRGPAVWLASVLLGWFSLISIVLLAGAELGWDQGTLRALSYAGVGVFLAAGTAFVAVYPSFPGRGWRALLLGFAAFPLVQGLAAIVVRAWWGPADTFAYVNHANNWDTIFLDVPTIAFGAMVLASGPGMRRTQLVFVLFPNLVHTVNHSPQFVRDLLVGTPLVDAILSNGFGSLRVVIGLALIVALLVQAWRQPAVRRQNVNVVLGTAALVPLALLQFTHSSLHAHVDFLFGAILFYGIARYHVLDVDFGWSMGLGKAMRGTVAVPAFFIGQQAVEKLVDSTLGLVAGALLAGLSLLAVQAFQRRLVARAIETVPLTGNLPSYDAFRRVEIYRAALEPVLADGRLSARESAVLAALRSKLGITLVEHDAIERDLRPSSAPHPWRSRAAD